MVHADSDLPALLRWVEAINELHVLKAKFDAEPTTEGSRRQSRINPLASRIGALEGVIARLEDAFGMTPQARMRLGIRTFAVEHQLSELFDGDEGDGAEWVQVGS